ncbi:hypothetical protein M0802_005200 [Mischocyttarus mexicanus]|nr:hypothetical protein M0802_013843 [Mischocyttarus mexicanus]KAI4499630.1 hypothetical protein M0802_005200 [Mischocyttarus mexicanus]
MVNRDGTSLISNNRGKTLANNKSRSPSKALIASTKFDRRRKAIEQHSMAERQSRFPKCSISDSSIIGANRSGLPSPRRIRIHPGKEEKKSIGVGGTGRVVYCRSIQLHVSANK